MHHHHLTSWEWAALGAFGTWLFSGLTSTMPPYTGNNYWAKWGYALMHWAGANWKFLHIPGSPGDQAAAPSKSNGENKNTNA